MVVVNHMHKRSTLHLIFILKYEMCIDRKTNYAQVTSDKFVLHYRELFFLNWITSDQLEFQGS